MVVGILRMPVHSRVPYALPSALTSLSATAILRIKRISEIVYALLNFPHPRRERVLFDSSLRRYAIYPSIYDQLCRHLFSYLYPCFFFASKHLIVACPAGNGGEGKNTRCFFFPPPGIWLFLGIVTKSYIILSRSNIITFHLYYIIILRYVVRTSIKII